MFNAKRLFFLFILIISSLLTLMNFWIVLNFLMEVPSKEGLGIFLIAWPLVLGWFIYASILFFLVFFSWRKIQEIDRAQISRFGISASQVEQRVLSSFEMSPLVKFGVYFTVLTFIMVILVNLFQKINF